MGKNYLKGLAENFETIMGVVFEFLIRRFDNFELSLTRLFDKDLDKETKKKIIFANIANVVVFTFMIGSVINDLLKLDTATNINYMMGFFIIGLIVYLILLYTVEPNGEKVKYYWGNMMKTIFMTLRIGLVVKIIMYGVAIIASIPVIGPLFLFGFVVINLPKVIKQEIARFC